jgi:multiple sugar transport system ATP-binding protein
MNNGKIEQVSAPQDLYRYPETTFVADFVGMPRINLIKLKEDSSNGTRYGNGEVSIDLGWSPGIREIVIGARPEDLILSQGDEAMGEEYQITAVMPNGPETFVQLARGNTAVLARADNDTKFKTSDIVHVGYNPKSINIYDTQTNSLVPYRGPK